MTTRVSRPNQAAISYSLLPIFSFRAVGTFRKEKGARYWPVLRPFALLYDVSSVPPKVPPDPGALGPGENSPSPGAAFPLLSIMPPPQLLRSGLAGLRDRLRRDAGFRGSVRIFGACARSRSSFRLLGDVIVHFAPTGHAFVKVVPFGLRRSFCETCCRITGHPRRIRFVG